MLEECKTLDGGEGGIRTLDTLRYTHFPGVLLRPLGHFTVLRDSKYTEKLHSALSGIGRSNTQSVH